MGELFEIDIVWLFVLFSNSLHFSLGFPKYPSGHLQTGSWSSTLQKAPSAQGSSLAQGLMQRRLRQAVYSGHSSLVSHPMGTGFGGGGRTGNKGKVLVLNINFLNLGYQFFTWIACRERFPDVSPPALAGAAVS